MKNFSKFLLVVSFGFVLMGSTMAATAPTLGVAASYGVYSDAGLTNTTIVTNIWGNVGDNNFGHTGLIASQVDGPLGIGFGTGVAAAVLIAYGQLDAQLLTPGLPLNLTLTTTVTPGVYDIGATVFNKTLTLNGTGVYIFRSTSSISTSGPAKVVLTNGADACNVFWQIPTSMTIGVGSQIIGTIIASTADITLGTNASLQGRAFSHTLLTLDDNLITEPTCNAVASIGGSERIPRLIPLINILKVPTPLVLIGSGLVTYNYTVQNIGPNLALRNITVNDDTCGPVTYISGDINNDGRLELTEKWYYRCTTRLSATTTNIVTVYGESDDSYRDVATDTATAIVVVTTGATTGATTPIITGLLTPPLINIVKIPSRLTPFLVGGGDVKYTYTVTNPGILAMHDVVVTDDKCSPVDLISGDTNRDHLLDVNETWTYTCDTHIYSSTKNTATAKGEANGFTVYDYAFANVYVTIPGLPKTGLTGTTPWNIIILAGILMIVSTTLVVVSKKRTI